jgi:hypothetical protein
MGGEIMARRYEFRDPDKEFRRRERKVSKTLRDVDKRVRKFL